MITPRWDENDYGRFRGQRSSLLMKSRSELDGTSLNTTPKKRSKIRCSCHIQTSSDAPIPHQSFQNISPATELVGNESEHLIDLRDVLIRSATLSRNAAQRSTCHRPHAAVRAHCCSSTARDFIHVANLLLVARGRRTSWAGHHHYSWPNTHRARHQQPDHSIRSSHPVLLRDHTCPRP